MEKSMAKKSYTDVLIDIEVKLSTLATISTFQENHLKNIDQHLNTLNERTSKNETAIAENRANTFANKDVFYKLGVPICIAAVMSGFAFILYLLGYIPI